MEITTPRRALSIPSRVIGENQLCFECGTGAENISHLSGIDAMSRATKGPRVLSGFDC